MLYITEKAAARIKSGIRKDCMGAPKDGHFGILFDENEMHGWMDVLIKTRPIFQLLRLRICYICLRVYLQLLHVSN